MMKTLFFSPVMRVLRKNLLMLLVLFTLGTAQAQQVSLFDLDRNACAYIDFSKAGTIFLWDGTPVAYLAGKKRDMCVYGFNGKFLGWYTNGMLYDNEGYITAKDKGTFEKNTGSDLSEPRKARQKFVPIRKTTKAVPVKPVSWQEKWSETILKDLLGSGTK